MDLLPTLVPFLCGLQLKLGVWGWLSCFPVSFMKLISASLLHVCCLSLRQQPSWIVFALLAVQVGGQSDRVVQRGFPLRGFSWTDSVSLINLTFVTTDQWRFVTCSSIYTLHLVTFQSVASLWPYRLSSLRHHMQFICV